MLAASRTCPLAASPCGHVVAASGHGPGLNVAEFLPTPSRQNGDARLTMSFAVEGPSLIGRGGLAASVGASWPSSADGW